MQSIALSTAEARTPVSPTDRAAGPGLADTTRIRICIDRRVWLAHKLAEPLVRECYICEERLADTETCGRYEHRSCTPCLDQWIERKTAAGEQKVPCPGCRERSVLEAEARDILNASFKKIRQEVQLDCAECKSWSGTVADMHSHIRRCQQQEHPCPRQAQGCDWTGPLADQPLHEEHCPRWPVGCQHAECDARIPRCEKQDHEAACPWRPVWLGALKTDHRTRQRMDVINNLCQRRRLEAGPQGSQDGSGELREEILQLWPLLYKAVQTPVTPLPVMPCVWRCGFEATADELDNHYRHCRLAPVECLYCHRGIEREKSVEHQNGCDDRPVVCPDGCGARNLRAGDISRGIHQRTCTVALRRHLPCRYCREPLRPDDLDTHQQHYCEKRPVRCSWCLATHEAASFDDTTQLCRRELVRDARLGTQTLVLHPEALGPVYLEQTGGYDPVYIKLPGNFFRQALEGKLPGSQLTTGFGPHFLWCHTETCLRICYQPGDPFIDLFFSFDREMYSHSRVEAMLYAQDGRQLESLEAFSTRRGRVRCDLRFFDSRDWRLQCRALNILATGQHEGFFLKLKAEVDD